jgi:Holliday junction resolvasome RuvABC endonuclease subunit
MGSVQLIGRGPEDGAIGAALADWLADRITLFDPALVGIEAAIPHHKSINAGAIALGLAMMAKVICWRREVRLIECNVNRVRSRTVGRGNATKDDVVAWCGSQGWSVPSSVGGPDYDAADATAAWAFLTGTRGMAVAA